MVQAWKARQGEAHGSWADKLSSILWSYRTTTKTATKETPYSMEYGTEAVLPAEIGQSARIMRYGLDNDTLHAMDLYLVEENRDRAKFRMNAYRKKMILTQNKRAYPRIIEEGDLVMKKIKNHGERGNLDPKYEGPFKIVGRAGVTAYYLEDAEGKSM
ncbi:uncharacterized protein [Primulina eburnea]|uniref:uncharacterized protein n=1 Tax=Primulina eburnea TaxID=1245227 RepID=UPI003C6CA8D4